MLFLINKVYSVIFVGLVVSLVGIALVFETFYTGYDLDIRNLQYWDIKE